MGACILCVLCQVVLDIAIAAAAEARPTSLAVVYDELLRKEVENKADQLGQSWDFTEWFTHVDDNTLRQARRQAVCLCLRDCCFPVCLCRRVPQVGQADERVAVSFAVAVSGGQPPPKSQFQERPKFQERTKGKGKGKHSGMVFCDCMS